MSLDPNATAPTAAPPPVGSAVDDQKQKLDAMVASLIKQATTPRASGMPHPQPRYSDQEMTQQPFNMAPAYSKSQNVGIALQNVATTINNLVAQHKQNQTRNALADWQSFDNALQKAQMLAGDPSAPDYNKKVEEKLGEMPWVKANLDPANSKNMKRLKEMYKALNVDLLDEKENVYGAALKQHQKVKSAEKQLQSQMEQMQRLRQQTIQSRISNLAQQGSMQRPDPKEQLEAARTAQTAATEARLSKPTYEIHNTDDGRMVAVDPQNPKDVKVIVDGNNQPIMVGGKKTEIAHWGLDGPPYGISKNGQILMPNDPNWTAHDQKLLDAATKDWKVYEKEKIDKENRQYNHQLDLLDTREKNKTIRDYRRGYAVPLNQMRMAMLQSEQILKTADARGYITGPDSMVLLSRHMMQTVGAIKGSRLGQYLFNEHAYARPLIQDFEVLQAKIAGAGGKITLDQAHRFVYLAQQIYKFADETARSEAQLEGIDPASVVLPPPVQDTGAEDYSQYKRKTP